MKNQYIPKKLKFTIILNALYQRTNSPFTPYNSPEMLEHVGKVLMPNCNRIKFRNLYTQYCQTQVNIVKISGDWITSFDIVDYATTHNIKLYSKEYFGL